MPVESDTEEDVTQVTRIIEDAEDALRRSRNRLERAVEKTDDLPTDPEGARRIGESVMPPKP